MMVERGQTEHFVVSYDDTLSNGASLSDAVLAQCEQDLSAMSDLFGGIMPAAASLPFHVNLVPGGGGANHPSCLATTISCYIYGGTTATGLPGLVGGEVAEVLMATQARGWDCLANNGEALSRVIPTVLHPNLLPLFSAGNAWLNSSRPDWVTQPDLTDTDPSRSAAGRCSSTTWSTSSAIPGSRSSAPPLPRWGRPRPCSAYRTRGTGFPACSHSTFRAPTTTCPTTTRSRCCRRPSISP